MAEVLLCPSQTDIPDHKMSTTSENKTVTGPSVLRAILSGDRSAGHLAGQWLLGLNQIAQRQTSAINNLSAALQAREEQLIIQHQQVTNQLKDVAESLR